VLNVFYIYGLEVIVNGGKRKGIDRTQNEICPRAVMYHVKVTTHQVTRTEVVC